MPRERRLIASVIYNRLQGGHPARDRRHAPLRDRQLEAAAAPVRARRADALQHPPERGPAAGADRQPRHRLDQGRRPTRAARDYLFFVVKPNACKGEHAFAATDAEHQRNVARYEQARDEARRRARPRTADEARRSARISGRTQPLPGDDERGVPRARPRLAVREAAGAAGAVRGDRAGPARLRLRGRERDDPAQARGPRAGRRASARPRRPSGPPTP